MNGGLQGTAAPPYANLTLSLEIAMGVELLIGGPAGASVVLTEARLASVGARAPYLLDLLEILNGGVSPDCGDVLTLSKENEDEIISDRCKQ